jgi:hypothetical protein
MSECDCPAGPVSDEAKFPYREAVGSLMYLLVGTRPDLGNMVRQVSRYLKNPGLAHWAAVVRGLKYLNGTRAHGITLGGVNTKGADLTNILAAYSDADYGGCPDTKRSTSGYITYLFGSSPISWRSALQKSVTLSTTEAEYVALAAAVQEVLYMRTLLEELSLKQDRGTVIHEDNQSTIKIAKNPEHHGRCKHIDIRYFFVQERVGSGDIEIVYCPTDKMRADILTKVLGPQKFSEVRKLLGVRDKSEWLKFE